MPTRETVAFGIQVRIAAQIDPFVRPENVLAKYGKEIEIWDAVLASDELNEDLWIAYVESRP